MEPFSKELKIVLLYSIKTVVSHLNCGMLDALWSYELPRAKFPYLEICFLGFAAFRKRYASRKVQRNFRGFAASRRRSLASCFYFFLRPFYLIILLKGNLGRLLAWLCLYILRPLVLWASANPAPPAASVPAVADPVLPAPRAPSAQPARATRTV